MPRKKIRNAVTVAVIHAVQKMHDEGTSNDRIAEAMGFHSDTIARMLAQGEAYCEQQSLRAAARGQYITKDGDLIHQPPKRCAGCGAMSTFDPCMVCEMRYGQHMTRMRKKRAQCLS